MTRDQQNQITRLQRDGKGYRTIASELELPLNSVKSWCRRHPLSEARTSSCKQCGAPLTQTPGKRTRVFCSDQCRYLWWASHPESRGHKIEYLHTCRCCGKEFTNNRKTAAYCGRLCFARARAKVRVDG